MMNNELMNFDFDGTQLRTVSDENGNIYFVGMDVAKALGYSDTDQALRKNVDNEDMQTRLVDGSGQQRQMKLINESGLYSLIFSSNLKAAKRFKRWVTSEVLPTIRKTGGYGVSQADVRKEYALKAELEDKTEKRLLLTRYIRRLREDLQALEDKRYLKVIPGYEPKQIALW